MGMLEGKICVVTGGAGSIGRATARLMLEEGARLVLSDLSAEGLERAGAELPDGEVALLPTDVSDADSVRTLAARTRETFGHVDVVFSNAGNFGAVAPIENYPENVFEAVHAVHVRGAFLVAKYLTPLMGQGGSFIINSSVAATRGDPGVYAYITAKHAQVGLMRCLAKELAPRGIRVNTIHPGPIDNDFQLDVEKGLGEEIGRDGTAFFNEMIPMGRHGSPKEIARSVLYLASSLSSFTTGSMLMADGGMSA
ncbi:NAD(P)-dependent dehydrogenase, short-chain alcohol dehydrogenase family [Pelagibacterium halotolerans]|nr:SDR family oxidoreductase [Pelagibacterium halotolerans]SEA79506.1 NAD(P)-dependent dehydrogenase, short-chain alcohol dehydrogenase family [Pelagibacterium halotolerans]